MSIETIITATLSPLVANRVYPDVAPEGSTLPRMVYQQVGGQVISYVEEVVPDIENGRFQVAVWAISRAQAKTLIKQAEAALLLAAGIQAESLGASVSEYEEDTGLYGSRQDFSLWAPR